jgi:hypothetical protein
VLAFSVDRDGDLPGTPSVNPQIKVAKPPITQEEPLHAELKAFLNSVRHRSRPLVALEDGRRALALALDIVAEIQRHQGKILDRL